MWLDKEIEVKKHSREVCITQLIVEASLGDYVAGCYFLIHRVLCFVTAQENIFLRKALKCALVLL